MNQISIIVCSAALALAGVACGERELDEIVEDEIEEFFEDDEQRAYADMSSALGSTEALRVGGRLVYEDQDFDVAESTPLGEVAQDEIRYTNVRLQLVTGEKVTEIGVVKSDGEGDFSQVIDLSAFALDAGDYTLRALHAGVVVGSARARLLAPGHEGILIRSDVDLTYLDTNFTTKIAMVKLLGQTASKRKELAAMPVVYRSLRSGADGNANRPTVFLSGSPRFFKRVIEVKMARDGVVQDGVELKPFKDIASEKVLAADLDLIVPALKEQIGYKLEALLRLRLDAPASAPEILMGDDSEADVVVYALYHRFTCGELGASALLEQLADLGVGSSWRDRIAKLAPQVLTHLSGMPAPVRAIYINQTGKHSGHYPVATWATPQLTRYHEGAWPLALDAYESGWISEASVRAVRDELLARGQSLAQLNEAAEAAIDRGFVDAATPSTFD